VQAWSGGGVLIKLLLITLFCTSAFADLDNRLRVYLRTGYILQDIAGNRPQKGGDFLSLLVGGHVHYTLGSQTLIGLNATVAFAPFRDSTRIEINEEEIRGDAFIRTNYYSLPFYYRPEEWKNYYLGIGPALTLNHIQYKNFSKNEAGIEKRNKLLLKNVGIVTGVKKFLEDNISFIEANMFVVYWDEFFLVNDSSLDAQVIEEDESLEKRINFTLSLSYGALVF